MDVSPTCENVDGKISDCSRRFEREKQRARAPTTHLRKEDRADERIVLETVQDSNPLDLRRSSVDEGLSELDGVGLREKRRGKEEGDESQHSLRTADLMGTREANDVPRERKRYPKTR